MAASKKNSLMRLYRWMYYCYTKHIPLLPSILSRYIRVIYSIDLPPSVKIGKNSLFMHNGLGCVIHARTVIGEGVKIYQNVTVGGRNGMAAPVIEDNVTIGAGACILGNIVIHKNSNIGANAVVIKDVSEGITVVGIPGRPVSKNGVNK